MDALIGHLLGDFIFQNDWMASGKKKSSLICLVHCWVWTLCVMVGIFGLRSYEGSPWVWLASFLWLLGTHFVIDRWGFVRWWMGTMGQDNFAGPPCGPWSIIFIDQIFHLLTIQVVLKLAF